MTSRSRRASRRQVSATEAAKNFGRLVDRVREEQSEYVVVRSGIPVVTVSPVTRTAFTVRDLKTLIKERRRAVPGFAEAAAQAVARHNRPQRRRDPWAR